jgi:hypothetical protein
MTRGSSIFAARLGLLGVLTITTSLLSQAISSSAAVAKENPYNNIFTPPDHSEEPGFTTSSNNLWKIPTVQQVRAIPSLSGVQRKQITDLYLNARTNNQSLMDELRGVEDQLRILLSKRQAAAAKPKNAQIAVFDDGNMANLNERKTELQEELNSRDRDLWEQVQEVLYPDQIEEYDKMKRGKLIPFGTVPQ